MEPLRSGPLLRLVPTAATTQTLRVERALLRKKRPQLAQKSPKLRLEVADHPEKE